MGHQLKVVEQIRTLWEAQVAPCGLQWRADGQPAEGVWVTKPSLHRTEPLQLLLVQELQRSKELNFTGNASAIGREQSPQCCV